MSVAREKIPADVWRDIARGKKARALADFLWTRLTLEERRSPRLLDVVASLSDEDRLKVANAAAVRAPSLATWTEVGHEIQRLQALECAAEAL